jgi:putative phage-type endonuclease
MSALIQQSPEWLEARKGKVGASDAPIIMGVSPWTTPYQLWLEKTSISNGKEKNWAQSRGLDLEDQARAKLEEMTGLCFFPEVALHPEHQWMMASLDGMEVGRKHIAEIKCPGFEDHSTALLGQIPEKYYPQLQHQLEVCGLDMVYYFSFDGENGVILECQRDDKYIKAMVKKEKAFWDCVQSLTPPELTDRDYHIKSDDIWTSTAGKWLSISQQLKEIEMQEKNLRDQLISLSDKKNSIGGGIKLCKSLRKGNVEYNRIPELNTIDLDVYRKEPSEVWRISQM